MPRRIRGAPPVRYRFASRTTLFVPAPRRGELDGKGHALCRRRSRRFLPHKSPLSSVHSACGCRGYRVAHADTDRIHIAPVRHAHVSTVRDLGKVVGAGPTWGISPYPMIPSSRCTHEARGRRRDSQARLASAATRLSGKRVEEVAAPSCSEPSSCKRVWRPRCIISGSRASIYHFERCVYTALTTPRAARPAVDAGVNGFTWARNHEQQTRLSASLSTPSTLRLKRERILSPTNRTGDDKTPIMRRILTEAAVAPVLAFCLALFIADLHSLFKLVTNFYHGACNLQRARARAIEQQACFSFGILRGVVSIRR